MKKPPLQSIADGEANSPIGVEINASTIGPQLLGAKVPTTESVGDVFVKR